MEDRNKVESESRMQKRQCEHTVEYCERREAGTTRFFVFVLTPDFCLLSPIVEKVKS